MTEKNTTTALPAEIRFKVIVGEELPSCEGNVLVYNTSVDTPDPSWLSYVGPGALVRMLLDLYAGRSLPLTFYAREIDTGLDALAIAVFLGRDLALLPGLYSLVCEFDLLAHGPKVSAAHLDSDKVRFFEAIGAYLTRSSTKHGKAEAVTTVVGWLRDYLINGTMASLVPQSPTPTVIERGTNGFALAVCPQGHCCEDGTWANLYRQGSLWGLMIERETRGDKRVMQVRKKSAWIEPDLRKAALWLTQVEAAAWSLDPDTLTLTSPEGGSGLLVLHVVEILVRILFVRLHG